MRAAALWLACGAALAEAPEPVWRAGARVVLAHDRFDAGVHGERAAAVGWLRRADLELQAAAGPWRALLALRNGGDGQWPVQEFRLGRAAGGTEAWIGRFDPDFGLEPASGSAANPLPEPSPVWDLAPHADDGSDATGLQWRGGSGPWSGSAGLLAREDRPQLNLRLAHGIAGAGVSLAWRPLALDEGRLRSRLGVRGSAEHPAGHRATLAPRGDFGADLTLAAHATQAPAPGWRLQGELLWRHLAGRGEADRQARAAVLQAAWTPGGAARALDPVRGRLRAPRGDAAPWTWVLRTSRLQVPQGGAATQWSLGAEWRWHPRSRLLAAWSGTRLRAAPGAVAESGQALAFRWEWET